MVAVCADLSPIDVSSHRSQNWWKDMPRTTLPFQATKPAKIVRRTRYGNATLSTSKGFLIAAIAVDNITMMQSNTRQLLSLSAAARNR